MRSNLIAQLSAKTLANVEFDVRMRLVSDVAQKAAQAEETKVTCTEPHDSGGPSSAIVKPRGGNRRGKTPNKGEIYPLNSLTPRPQD